MNIPECVRIGSCFYDVDITDEQLVVNRGECYGYIEYDNHRIRINKTMGDIQHQEQTFLHELMHGIADDRSIDFKEDDPEFIIDELAKGLHQVILDNPHIFIDFEEEGEDD